MDIHNFGHSEIKTTRIGLGTAALGRPGYINLGHGEDFSGSASKSSMEERTHSMLDLAYSRGIRYFDTARSYGMGEEFLGNWLKAHPELKDITVGSKWGYTYTADWQIEANHHEVKEHSLSVLNRQWVESRENLHPDIYQIHSATLESGVLSNQEVLDKLWSMKDTGIVIGLSLSGPGQAETLGKAMEVQRNGELLFGAVQATWNLLETSAAPQLRTAAESGMGVIIKESVANGRLTQRNEDEVFRNKASVLFDLAQKHNTGIDAISIAYILHQNWVSIVLSGASTRDQLDQNLDALSVHFEQDELEALDQMAESSEEYWKKRSALSWN